MLLKQEQPREYKDTENGTCKKKKYVICFYFSELQWLKESYNLERCQKWVKHAWKVQRKTKDIIQQKIKDRFEIVVVPR